MRRRVRASWLAVAIAIVLNGYCVARPARVYVVPSTIKIIRDQEPPPEATDNARIHAARGGKASFQVFVSAGNFTIAGLQASVSALTSSSAAIPESAVNVRNVAYVPIAQATPYEVLAWPEMLENLPVKNGLLHGRKPADIVAEPDRALARSPWKAGQIGDVLPPMTPQAVGPFYNGGFWVCVKIPSNQPPGVYTGTVKLTGKDFEASVPVSLRVWSFNIPYAVHLPWHLGIGSGATLKNYDMKKPDEAALSRDLYLKMIDWFFDYRITPSMCAHPDFQAPGLRMNLLAPEILKRIRDERCTFIDFMSFDLPLSDKELEMMAELKKMGLDKKVFIRINEESARTEVTAKVAAAMRSRFPDARAGGTVPGTLFQNTNLFGVINYWCVEWGLFDPEETIARQKAGDTVMWYTCCGPRYPYPNFFLEEPSLDQRIYSWMASKYDLQGVLYYGATYWSSDNTGLACDPTLEGCSDWARYGTLSKPGSGNNTIGPHNHCGVLIYPGDKYGLDHPVASVRLENLNAGLEDYETLWCLEKRINELKAELDPQSRVLGGWDGKARRKEIIANAVETISIFLRDPAGFHQVQRELCEELETLTAGPKVLFKIEPVGSREIKVTGVAGAGVKVLLNNKELTGAFSESVKVNGPFEQVFKLKIVAGDKVAEIPRRLSPPMALN